MRRAGMMLLAAGAVLSTAIIVSGCGGGGSAVTNTAVSSARIVSVAPNDNATGVPATATVSITFSMPMNMGSVNTNFHIYQGNTATGTPISGSYTWNDAHTAMVFDPDGTMMAGATHTIFMGMGMMSASNGGMMNMGNNNMMAQDMIFHFKTK